MTAEIKEDLTARFKKNWLNSLYALVVLGCALIINSAFPRMVSKSQSLLFKFVIVATVILFLFETIRRKTSIKHFLGQRYILIIRNLFATLILIGCALVMDYNVSKVIDETQPLGPISFNLIILVAIVLSFFETDRTRNKTNLKWLLIVIISAIIVSSIIGFFILNRF